jgi:hypothetical protein
VARSPSDIDADYRAPLVEADAAVIGAKTKAGRGQSGQLEDVFVAPTTAEGWSRRLQTRCCHNLAVGVVSEVAYQPAIRSAPWNAPRLRSIILGGTRIPHAN